MGLLDTIKGWFSKAKDTAGDVAGDVGDKVGDVVETVKDKFDGDDEAPKDPSAG